MDFSKLQQQRDARQAAAVEPPAPAPRASRQRRQVQDSKRSSWLMRAWYVQPETARQLRAYVNRQQDAGDKVDASDVVDRAIRAWLEQQGS
jgi:hypothetical protein